MVKEYKHFHQLDRVDVVEGVMVFKCVACNINKPSTEFSQHKRSWIGIKSRCKACESKVRGTTEYRKQISNYGKEDRRVNSEWYMWSNAKNRAKKMGLPFNIEPKHVKIPNICPVLGISMAIANGKPNDNSPSLDKIKPALGYVVGNTCVVSYRCNRIKSNATVEELEGIISCLEKYENIKLSKTNKEIIESFTKEDNLNQPTNSRRFTTE